MNRSIDIKRLFALTVNDKPVTVSASPGDRLSSVLREKLGLTGTKIGCDAGDCGACTVLLDNEAVCACLVSVAQAQGGNVRTVEGLSTDGRLSRLQSAFLEHGAAQCGICTPGMLMASRALLNDHPRPDRRAIDQALGGVLCRCTGYAKIVEAVLSCGQEPVDEPRVTHGTSPANSLREASTSRPTGDRTSLCTGNVGLALPHLDGRAKVDGKLRFGADVDPSDMRAVRVIRSPHHAAAFTLGDVQAFVASHAGIDCLLTADDIPGLNAFGVIPGFVDQPVLADERVRFRGEAVALLVGDHDTLKTLDDQTFPVHWQPEPHRLQPAATTPACRALHADRPDDILIEGHVERGDAQQALGLAEHTVTVRTSTPYVEHSYIEPEAGYCVRRGDRLEIHGCTQAAHMDRESLAAILDLPLTSIRVVPSACGGGFGAKLDLSFQPYVALAAWILKCPARLVYTRGESMRASTKRHPSEITLSVGCDANGLLRGFDFRGTFNTGAYASWGPTVANRVPIHACGPYRIPDYRAHSIACHTHGPAAGAFRGFGVPQAAIAQETAFDQLADRAGIDRLDFRLRNALANGEATVTGQVFETGVGISACLEALQARWEQSRRNACHYNEQSSSMQLKKGVGIAACWYGCGNTSLPNPSTVRLGIRADGVVVLHQGAMDIGQGANTVITQIVADALGVDVHAIERIGGDTDLTPDCGKTSASRQTYVTGMAAKRAGEALRRKLLRLGNVGPEASIELGEGTVLLHDSQQHVAVDLSTFEPDRYGYVLLAEETYDPPTTALDERGQGSPYAVYGYGAQLVELTVDTTLGRVSIDHISTAHDVGRAINPLLIEGQIEGGVAQGIGLALMEEYLPGRTENLHDYLIPTIGDMPTFDHQIIEVADAEGPYGAKGLGEHVLIPTAPAILNAIRDATGAVVEALPATPERVLAAIEQARQGSST